MIVRRVISSTILALAMAAAAMAQPATGPATGKPDKRPNILFIVSDQYRNDCMGVSGNKTIHTPNLDRLARQGVHFTHTYAAQPVCSPNRAAIITGLYPHTAGLNENNIPLPKTSRAMSEMLAPAGYDCGYFGKWHLGRRDAFETFPEYPNDGRGNNHYFGKGESRKYGVDVITADAIEFLKQKRTKPFYVYASFYPPHPPLSVPEPYLKPYKAISDREKRIYYAMCSKIDEKVGELLKALDDLGVADNTLVVFTSDHGHNFIKRWNHHEKRLCYDTASRVPLLMRMPGAIPEGRKVDALISSVDLTPTLLSLVGQPVPSGLQGLDFSALARGKSDKGRDYVFIENVPFTEHPEQGEERCVLDERYKLILSTVRSPELYDMKSDPEENTNLWDKMKGSEEVGRLKKQLRTWGRETADLLARGLVKASK